jgi:hypothetical protein
LGRRLLMAVAYCDEADGDMVVGLAGRRGAMLGSFVLPPPGRMLLRIACIALLVVPVDGSAAPAMLLLPNDKYDDDDDDGDDDDDDEDLLGGVDAMGVPSTKVRIPKYV